MIEIFITNLSIIHAKPSVCFSVTCAVTTLDIETQTLYPLSAKSCVEMNVRLSIHYNAMTLVCKIHHRCLVGNIPIQYRDKGVA